jgi:ketosteroid isomerase-like protein
MMAMAAIEHPNATTFRAGYEAFNRGDLNSVRGFLADDIVWHESGTSRFAGDQHGVEETLASFVDLATVTGGTFHLDVHDILANDTHATALVTAHWEFEGRAYEDKGVHVVHMRDGKIAESWYFNWSDTFDQHFPG